MTTYASEPNVVKTKLKGLLRDQLLRENVGISEVRTDTL